MAIATNARRASRARPALSATIAHPAANAPSAPSPTSLAIPRATSPGAGRKVGARNVRAAMARDGLDAVVVSGNEYTGFEGAVTYMSGFVIVHRYAYVLLPLEGQPSIVFPREARYVGEHGTSWIDDQVFVDKPGEWLADRVKGTRVGVYGLDYVMTVRDYAALEGAAEIVAWDEQFDHARAVKSDLELASVRDSVRINTEGFWIFLEHFERIDDGAHRADHVMADAAAQKRGQIERLERDGGHGPVLNHKGGGATGAGHRCGRMRESGLQGVKHKLGAAITPVSMRGPGG